MNALQLEQEDVRALPNIKCVEIMTLILVLSGHQFKIVPQELFVKMESAFLHAKMNALQANNKEDVMVTSLRKELVEIMIPTLALSGLLGGK